VPDGRWTSIMGGSSQSSVRRLRPPFPTCLSPSNEAPQGRPDHVATTAACVERKLALRDKSIAARPCPHPITDSRFAMLDRRIFLLATAILVAPPALAQAPSPDDPVAFLTAIYARAAKGKGDSGGSFVFDTKAAKAKYLSTSLVTLWAQADAHTPKGDVGPVDFDPVTNSQEPDVKTFKVAPDKIESDHAAVTVSFTTRHAKFRDQKDTLIRYDLVREAGGWKIDDIKGTTEGESWSIRSMLAESLKS
jgi:Protein of unknown function (DUF3828)